VSFQNDYRDRLVSFQKDLSSNSSHLNTTLRHSNTRSTLLKLIYIISSSYKPKIKFFEYFLPIHQATKWTAESSELVRSMFLDIQILDSAIWSWSKHLKTLTNQFLLGFKCSTPLNKPTHYLGRPFFLYLMYGQKVFKTLDFWFINTWNNINQLQRVNLVFECRMLIFEWEGFGLESFWNDTSLSLSLRERERERERERDIGGFTEIVQQWAKKVR